MARNETGTAPLDKSSKNPLENPASEEEFEKTLKAQQEHMAKVNREIELAEALAIQNAKLPEISSTGGQPEFVGEERAVGYDPEAPMFRSLKEALAVRPSCMTLVAVKDPITGEMKSIPESVENPKFRYAQDWIAAEMRLKQIRPEPEARLRTYMVDGHADRLVQARSDIQALAAYNDLYGTAHLNPAGRKVREVKSQAQHLPQLTTEDVMREMAGSAFVG